MNFVTIVDAMILGRLFKNIFFKNIKILIPKLIDLYKDGLQREQFTLLLN